MICQYHGEVEAIRFLPDDEPICEVCFCLYHNESHEPVEQCYEDNEWFTKRREYDGRD